MVQLARRREPISPAGQALAPPSVAPVNVAPALSRPNIPIGPDPRSPDFAGDVNVPALPGAPGEALSPTEPVVGPTEKPPENKFGVVGKVLGAIGKAVTTPDAADMLASLGVAVGTSQSGVQSLGARIGTQVLASSQARKAGELAERQVATGEARAATLESQFQFDMETWINFGQQSAELQNETDRIKADTALIRSNTALIQAGTAAIDAEIANIRALSPGDVSLNDQVKAIRLYTAKARAAVVSLGFGKLTVNDDGSTTFTITEPGRGNAVYDEVFAAEVTRGIEEGYLPEIPVISYQGEDRTRSLVDDTTGIDTLKSTLETGTEPAPATAAEVNVGDVLAGISSFGGPDVEGTRAAQTAAVEEKTVRLESRVQFETVTDFGPGLVPGRTTKGKVLPPEGAGTKDAPFLLYIANDAHKDFMDELLKTTGVYLDVNENIIVTTGDPRNPKEVK